MVKSFLSNVMVIVSGTTVLKKRIEEETRGK
jgi:hypothetical protein